ncbi:hypothetical protein FB45DRAFT_1085112 [Roridomyces roridus]|uniref:Uncharacterized protein n=1 Tax=Roridomyces roridus TaxID=1738132 RepID=A0AAD7BP46_9AGAR|nr:hypothetical protein FB45DRAFT_1085112 [Roridomyces roridus]
MASRAFPYGRSEGRNSRCNSGLDVTPREDRVLLRLRALPTIRLFCQLYEEGAEYYLFRVGCHIKEFVLLTGVIVPENHALNGSSVHARGGAPRVPRVGTRIQKWDDQLLAAHLFGRPFIHLVSTRLSTVKSTLGPSPPRGTCKHIDDNLVPVRPRQQHPSLAGLPKKFPSDSRETKNKNSLAVPDFPAAAGFYPRSLDSETASECENHGKRRARRSVWRMSWIIQDLDSTPRLRPKPSCQDDSIPDRRVPPESLHQVCGARWSHEPEQPVPASDGCGAPLSPLTPTRGDSRRQGVARGSLQFLGIGVRKDLRLRVQSDNLSSRGQDAPSREDPHPEFSATG